MKLPKRRFQQEIKRRFIKDEIRAVCFDLGINHEELDEKTITTLTESLLLYVEKRGRIMDLVDILRSERPQIDWSALAFADVDCPYRGLLPFREEDAHLFFGRDAYTERLLEVVDKRPLVAVIGPSGSGKSSVVFAGLVPRLRPTDQQQTGQWQVVDFSPGKKPFETLCGELIPLLEPDLSENAQLVEANALSENLVEGKISLHQVMARIAGKMDDGIRILLIVDQFEELYTQTEEITLQEDFTKALLSLHQVEAVTVMLTMRADFLDRALAYRPFADELQAATQMIGPMDRDELIEVIERPLSGTFVTFEPGLTTQILDDVGKEPGNLPLLEFALESLWQEQVDGKLTFAVYEKIGKVEGALTKQADAAFNTYEEKDEDVLVRRLFVQLVQPVNTSVNTKRKAWRSELGDELWQLAGELADDRLIVTNQDDKSGEDYIELAHEALINNWERFAGWIKEDWEFRAWQERLRINLRQWESHDEDKGFLLLNAPLAVAEEWLGKKQVELNDRETEFIEASIEAEEKRQADEKQRQERELAQAKELAAEQQQRAEIEQKAAEEQKQAATDLRRRLMYVVGFAVLAAILGIAAVSFGFRSAENAAEAERNLVTATFAEGEALAQAAAAQAAEATAVSAEGSAEFNASLASTRAVKAERAEAAAVSAQATAVVDRENAVASAEEANRQLRISQAQAAAVYASQVLSDENDKELATLLALEANYLNNGEDTNVPSLVDEVLRKTLSQPFFNRTLRGLEGGVQDLSYDHEGTLAIATGFRGSLYGSVYFWDEKTNPEPQLIVADGLGVFAVDFSSNETTQMAFGGQKGYVNLWMTWDSPMEFAELFVGAYVNSINFSSDGYYLAVVASDNTIHIFHWLGEEAQQVLNGGNGSFAVFSPDCHFLAAAGTDNTILIWESSSSSCIGFEGEPTITLNGHQGSVQSLVFSPNGTLVSASEDGTIRLWDVDNFEKPPIVLDEHQDSVNAMDVSPDGQTLASASSDNTVRLWNMNDLDAAPHILPHESSVRSVAFSPDSRSLASSTGGETVIIWDLESPTAAPSTFTAGTNRIDRGIDQIAFVPPEGQFLARLTITEGSQDQIRFWNTNDLVEESDIAITNEQGISSMVFSDDGQTLFIEDDFGGVYQRDIEDDSSYQEILPGDGIYINDIAISPDNRYLAVTKNDNQVLPCCSNSVYLLDLTKPNADPAILNHPSQVYEVEFSPDGKFLVSVGDEDPNSQATVLIAQISTIYLWNVESIESGPIALEGHEDRINAIAFSQDGSILAGASQDDSILLWNIKDPTDTPQTLRRHTGGLRDVTFSPDGQVLASTDFYGNVFLWNMRDLSEPPISILHETGIEYITFSPDGKTLAGAAYDDAVYVWQLPEQLIELGCQKLQRNLSWQDWQQYLPNQSYRQTCPDLPVHPTVPVDERP